MKVSGFLKIVECVPPEAEVDVHEVYISDTTIAIGFEI